MTTGKEISIVIPTRNEEKYIHKCTDSLINQNYPHEKYEIRVGPRVFQEYVALLYRLRYLLFT